MPATRTPAQLAVAILEHAERLDDAAAADTAAYLLERDRAELALAQQEEELLTHVTRPVVIRRRPTAYEREAAAHHRHEQLLGLCLVILSGAIGFALLGLALAVQR